MLKEGAVCVVCSCHMLINEDIIMYAYLPSEGFPGELCISWSDATDHIL